MPSLPPPPTPAGPPPADGPLFVVLNPGSGAGEAEATAAAIRAAAAGAGRAVELFVVGPGRSPAACAGEALRRAAAADGVVVAAGGDGTLNAVAQAVLSGPTAVAFGVLPRGTFNYFGRAHGIPTALDEALTVLLQGRPQPVQVGQVNGRVFLVNASLGLYPRLLEDREGWKAQLGRSRLVALGAALWSLLRGGRSLRLRVDVAGQARDVRTPTLFVGNNALQLAQLGLPLAPAVEAGALGALMLKPVGRWRMLGLLLRGALGRLGQADDLLQLACRSLTVNRRRAFGPRSIKVATDGEVLRLRLPLQFTVAPRPLWLIRPAPPALPRERA